MQHFARCLAAFPVCSAFTTGTCVGSLARQQAMQQLATTVPVRVQHVMYCASFYVCWCCWLTLTKLAYYHERQLCTEQLAAMGMLNMCYVLHVLLCVQVFWHILTKLAYYRELTLRIDQLAAKGMLDPAAVAAAVAAAAVSAFLSPFCPGFSYLKCIETHKQCLHEETYEQVHF